MTAIIKSIMMMYSMKKGGGCCQGEMTAVLIFRVKGCTQPTVVARY